jgi:hypothetical protein
MIRVSPNLHHCRPRVSHLHRDSYVPRDSRALTFFLNLNTAGRAALPKIAGLPAIDDEIPPPSPFVISDDILDVPGKLLDSQATGSGCRLILPDTLAGLKSFAPSELYDMNQVSPIRIRAFFHYLSNRVGDRT